MNRENDLDNKKIERISKILRESEVIPPAPDCRKAVMNRISGRKKMHPVRVYAFGLAVIAIIAVLGGLRMWNAERGVSRIRNVESGVRNEGKVATRPYHSDKKDVNKLKIVPLPDYKKIAEITPSPSDGKSAAVKSPLPLRERVRVRVINAPRHTKQHNRTLPLLVKNEAELHEKPTPTPIQHIQVQGLSPNQTDKPPVALVVVSWPSSRDNPQGDCNYSYTKRDIENETTTECKVKRSGNNIEIHLESKPEGEKPPVKGSVDNETNPSA